jgi:dipeptidyl aminopeptidase/acylaminoacyl peptidase
MQTVKKAYPNTFNAPVSSSSDFKSVIIGTWSDVEAGAYFAVDIAGGGKSTRIGRAYPELNADELPRMRSIEYKAADGTTIPGYLTAPVNVREEKLPMIVMPHGGPRARDSWRFDFLRHFLASRGYAVLQMNFRGSTGFGGKWFEDAFQDWGGLTYSDIADGARWAISQGIADPKRVCIVGWSFGGYSALVGATRNADLFKCSISIAGLSDLVALRSSVSGALNSQVVQKQIGNDKSKLRENSPIEHASETNMPVLLVHGTMDAQAPYEQSKAMAAELKKANKNFKFVTIENADHSLLRESERVTLLTEVEQFLQTNLGPGKVSE